MLTETSTQVKQADLCKSKLCVDSKKFTMWVDASSLVIRFAMETGGSIVKDVC